MPKKTLAFLLIAFIIIIIILIFLLPWILKQKTGEDYTFTQAIQEIFPFGKTSPSDVNKLVNTGGDSNGNKNNPSLDNELSGGEKSKIPRLRHITTVPTAGATIVEKDREIVLDKIKKKVRDYFVRYIYRGNGHVEETWTRSLDVSKISNNTIPKIYEATFTPNGQGFVARFLGDNIDDIKTYSATLIPRVATTTATSTPTTNPESKLQDVSGKYLDLNIREIAFSPLKNNILSLFTSGDNGNIVFSDINGNKKQTLYSGALREWLLSYSTETEAVIATKPSGFAYGFAYKLNTTTGALTKIIGNVPGLTILPSRNLSYILVGRGNESLSLSAYKTNDVLSAIQSLNTMPEKCVWSKKDLDVFYCAVPKTIPSGVYPDDWYKGNVSFNDDIWKIDLETGFSSLLVSPTKEVGQEIDAVNLNLSSTDNYLTFINKKDLTLWEYDVLNEANKTDEELAATSTPATKK